MSNEELELSAEWQDWVTDNALQGATIAELIQALVEEGLEQEFALAEVTRLLNSGPFRAAIKWRRQALRYKKVNSLKLALHRWHGPPQIERRHSLSLDNLRCFYLRAGQPVILTDVLNQSPAISKWTDQYLKDKVGQLTVTCCRGRESAENPCRDIKRFLTEMSFADFVDEIQETPETNDFYLVGNNNFIKQEGADILFRDIDRRLNRYLHKGMKPQYSSFWYGPKGTVTDLHYDPVCVLYGQFRGRKRFRLLSPYNAIALLEAQGNYSPVDLDDAAQRMGDLVYDVVLHPGELLLLPAGWWHQVTALDVSISIGFTNLFGATSFPWYTPGDEGDENNMEFK